MIPLNVICADNLEMSRHSTISVELLQAAEHGLTLFNERPLNPYRMAVLYDASHVDYKCEPDHVEELLLTCGPIFPTFPTSPFSPCKQKKKKKKT